MSVKRKLQNEIDLLKYEVEKKTRLVEEVKEDKKNEIKKIRDQEQERIIFALQNQRQRINYEKRVQFRKVLQQLRQSNNSADDVEAAKVLKSDCDKLAAIQFKNRMTSLSRRFSWHANEFSVCAMTPIEEEEDETNWSDERKNLLAEISELKSKLTSMERNRSELEAELQEARDQNELLEFRILEVEESNHNEQIERQIQLDKCMHTEIHLNRKQEEKLKELLKLSPWKNLSLHEKNELIQLLLQQHLVGHRNPGDDTDTNKNNILKQQTSVDDNDNSDIMIDNKSDVISQSGETGYSSDDEISSDTASPIPSFNESNQIPNNGNNVGKEFFWSLSEVARRIKESEATKTNLRAKNEKLEKDLRISEQETKEETKKKTIVEVELKQLTNKIEILNKLSAEKDQEMRNKEMEFALKMDAMKCERDEIVSKLENRIVVNNKTENKLREELERLAEAKNELEKEMKAKEEQYELEKEMLIKQINKLNVKNKNINIMIEEGEIYEDEVHKQTSSEINKVELKSNSLENESENKQLKQQIFELETKENAYRQTLHQADKLMADVEKNYQERLEEQERVEEQLRARIVQLEQSEKRLRQTLKNNKHNLQVSQFGELIDRLLECEASEQRLKNKIHHLEKQEKETKEKLSVTEAEKLRIEQEVQEQDELLTTISNLRHSERDLRKRINELETSEEALKETLAQADLILMEREKDLKEKIQYLEYELNRRMNEEAINSTNENRIATMADIIDTNSKLQFENEELKEINDSLRDKMFDLQSTLLARPDVNNSQISNNDHRFEKDCYVQLNLDILEKNSQIEKLSDKIRLLEAGNVPLEFHALSLHADELKHMKQKLNTFSVSIHKCNCCNCANCKLLVDDIEKQVSLLDQIISGSDDSNYVVDGTKGGEHLKSDVTDLSPSEKCICTTEINLNRDLICSCAVQLENELKEKIILVDKCEKQIESLENELAGKQLEFKTQIEELSRSQKEKDEEIERLRRSVWKAEVAERVLREKYFKKSQHVASANRQIRELEQKIINYSRQLRLFESTQREVENLRDKNHQLEIELKKGRENERKLHAENLHLHHKVESQKERIKSVQVMKKALASKVEYLEKNKRRAAVAKVDNESNEKKPKDNCKQITKQSIRTPHENDKSDNESMYCSTSSDNNWIKSKSKIPRYVAPTSAKDKRQNNNDDTTLKNIEKPFEPVNFRVTRKVGQDSLIVAWNLPQFDENISGYLISVNDELHQKVRSASRTKALLNRLQLSTTLKIDIESVNENGVKSNKVSCVWTKDQDLPKNNEYKRKKLQRSVSGDSNSYNDDDFESSASSSYELSARCDDESTSNVNKNFRHA